VTIKRIADLNPAVAVADPRKLPRLVASPAAGFYGRDGQRTRTGALTLPDQEKSPFDKVTGTERSVDTGPCPLTVELDMTVERAGDSKLGS
jgi:hypothetical protein